MARAVGVAIGCVTRWLILAGVSVVLAAQAQTPAAGAAKLEFDVVAVHPNHSGMPGDGGDAEFANIPMGPEETFRNTGGVFTARNTALIKFISFAYKLGLKLESQKAAVEFVLVDPCGASFTEVEIKMERCGPFQIANVYKATPGT